MENWNDIEKRMNDDLKTLVKSIYIGLGIIAISLILLQYLLT